AALVVSRRASETVRGNDDGRADCRSAAKPWTKPPQPPDLRRGRPMSGDPARPRRGAAFASSQESADTFRAIVESSPQAVIAVAPDRTVRLWNRAAEQIFGYA